MTILKDQRTKKRYDQDWIETIIEQLVESDFTGRMELNFFEGGIGNCNINESIRPPREYQNGTRKRTELSEMRE